jgi:hypothetical protein
VGGVQRLHSENEEGFGFLHILYIIYYKLLNRLDDKTIIMPRARTEKSLIRQARGV